MFHRLGFFALRFSFSLLFVWFGLLKLFNVSPVSDLILVAYPVIAQSPLLSFLLAILEVAIGIGIFIPRISVVMLWVMLVHLLIATIGVFHSGYAFSLGVPILSFMGEFALKNLALIGGALVLIAHDAPIKDV
jgi:putative oxidoreductase